MCTPRNPLHCIVPPFLLERLAESRDPKVRGIARTALGTSGSLRASRAASAPESASPGNPGKDRRVYDGQNGFGLPGVLVRSEGGPPSGDVAVDEAYDFTGETYDFFHTLFGRDSLDGRGLPLRSTVHYGDHFNNAMWDGAQMVFGDGDGIVFQRFTRARDVVGHELTHGLVGFTANFVYEGESGALNEHFADVFGVLMRQWRALEPAEKANWLIADDVLITSPTRRALRSMAAPGTAYRGDPDLGDDPQPDHVSKQYRGTEDNGGVHINSGIPNHAFYIAATRIGGNAWEQAGTIWYRSLLCLGPASTFADCARTTVQVAGELYGPGSRQQTAVRAGWDKVGVPLIGIDGIAAPKPRGVLSRTWKAFTGLFGS